VGSGSPQANVCKLGSLEGRRHGIAPHGHPSRRGSTGMHHHGAGAGARRQEEIVDSSGNKIEAGPMTFYEIEGSRIVDGRSDDNCLFRDYGPLEPVKR
jgi:hypothetical protein